MAAPRGHRAIGGECAATKRSFGVTTMQRFLILIALIAAAVFAYLHFSGSSSAGRYSLSDVEGRPIPRREFYELWRGTAERLCDTREQSATTLAPAACRDYVASHHDGCVAMVGAGAPETIATKAESRRLARPYLDCVVPAPFCNGVEVRTFEQARLHCPP